MSDMLAKLYAAKVAALEDEQRKEPHAELVERADRRRGERRPFRAALAAARGPAIVAEIKRASPSVGLIARNFDAALIAQGYERAGVDAISVLTESDHFLGDVPHRAVGGSRRRCRAADRCRSRRREDRGVDA